MFNSDETKRIQTFANIWYINWVVINIDPCTTVSYKYVGYLIFSCLLLPIIIALHILNIFWYIRYKLWFPCRYCRLIYIVLVKTIIQLNINVTLFSNVLSKPNNCFHHFSMKSSLGKTQSFIKYPVNHIIPYWQHINNPTNQPVHK